MRYEIAIVGGGLAGACAALWLSGDHSVVALEANEPASGATGVAAGLVNPIRGLRATPMWRHTEALAALHTALAEAGANELFRATGVFRPARDEEQAERFRDSAGRHADECSWLSTDVASERYPDVNAPSGGLWVPSGGVVDLPAFTHAMQATAARRGAVVHKNRRMAGWEERGDYVRVRTADGEFEATRLLLCLGAGYLAFPALEGLPLHRVKGQAVWLERPDSLRVDLPAVSASLYVVPDGDRMIVGSTFEHTFDDDAPDPAVAAELRVQGAALIPALAEATIVEARAGVRVTVPHVRLPLLGPIPGSHRVWIFSGLGAKGLMTAPLLSRDLATFLIHPEKLPVEVRPRG